jgi:hypothetical protein
VREILAETGSNQWTVHIGGGIAKILRFGKLPLLSN